MNKGLAKLLIITIILITGLTFHYGYKVGSEIGTKFWEKVKTINSEEIK